MNIKKTAITLATIIGFAILITGCSGSGLNSEPNKSFGTVITDWQTSTPTYLNDTTGVQFYGAAAAAPAVVDFDGNGTLDLVVGDVFGNLEVLLNGSTTGLEIQDSYMIGDANGPGYFCGDAVPWAFDADNDGQFEIFVGCADGSVLYVDFSDLTPNAMQYTVNPVISDSAPLIVPGGYAVPTIADLDRDGTTELLVTSGAGVVYFYRYLSMGAAPVMSYVSSDYNFGSDSALVAADLNNDSNIDFVIGKGDGWVQACEGPTPSACVDVIQVNSQAKPAVGDFDHDGLMDLVVGAADGSVLVMIATPAAP